MRPGRGGRGCEGGEAGGGGGGVGVDMKNVILHIVVLLESIGRRRLPGGVARGGEVI